MNDFKKIKELKSKNLAEEINLKKYIEENRDKVDRYSINKEKVSYNFDVSKQLKNIYKYHFNSQENKKKIYDELVNNCQLEVNEYKQSIEVGMTEILLLRKLEVEAIRSYFYLTIILIFLLIKMLKSFWRKNAGRKSKNSKIFG